MGYIIYFLRTSAFGMPPTYHSKHYNDPGYIYNNNYFLSSKRILSAFADMQAPLRRCYTQTTKPQMHKSASVVILEHLASACHLAVGNLFFSHEIYL